MGYAYIYIKKTRTIMPIKVEQRTNQKYKGTLANIVNAAENLYN